MDIPRPGTLPGDEMVAFAAALIDRSGTAPVIEAALRAWDKTRQAR